MTSNRGVDPLILRAWLTGRSVARGLPAPFPEHGGLRVDTNADAEVARWVFPGMRPGLRSLAQSIEKPRYFLKLCGSPDELRAVLPARWEVQAPAYFMRSTRWPAVGHLAEGYSIETRQTGAVIEAKIFSGSGMLAASGFAAEAEGAFVYDRIVTAPDHRRKGLGRSLMQALHNARKCPDGPELLVATEDGRALYATLGWETISLYSTAAIVAR